jgi:hypothetical protein
MQLGPDRILVTGYHVEGKLQGVVAGAAPAFGGAEIAQVVIAYGKVEIMEKSVFQIFLQQQQSFEYGTLSRIIGPGQYGDLRKFNVSGGIEDPEVIERSSL